MMKKDNLFIHPVHKEYGCDENGNVYSFMFGKIKKLKPAKSKDGYLHFIIRNNGVRKNYNVHRFVWECIKGEIPEGYEVDHRNFVRDDNRIENLIAISASENRARKSDNGKKASIENGKKGGLVRSKPVLQYDKQGNFIAEYTSLADVKRLTGLNDGNISSCCLGKRYKSVGGFIWKYKYV